MGYVVHQGEEDEDQQVAGHEDGGVKLVLHHHQSEYADSASGNNIADQLLISSRSCMVSWVSGEDSEGCSTDIMTSPPCLHMRDKVLQQASGGLAEEQFTEYFQLCQIQASLLPHKFSHQDDVVKHDAMMNSKGSVEEADDLGSNEIDDSGKRSETGTVKADLQATAGQEEICADVVAAVKAEPGVAKEHVTYARGDLHRLHHEDGFIDKSNVLHSVQSHNNTKREKNSLEIDVLHRECEEDELTGEETTPTQDKSSYRRGLGGIHTAVENVMNPVEEAGSLGGIEVVNKGNRCGSWKMKLTLEATYYSNAIPVLSADDDSTVLTVASEDELPGCLLAVHVPLHHTHDEPIQLLVGQHHTSQHADCLQVQVSEKFEYKNTAYPFTGLNPSYHTHGSKHSLQQELALHEGDLKLEEDAVMTRRGLGGSEELIRSQVPETRMVEHRFEENCYQSTVPTLLLHKSGLPGSEADKKVQGGTAEDRVEDAEKQELFAHRIDAEEVLLQPGRSFKVEHTSVQWRSCITSKSTTRSNFQYLPEEKDPVDEISPIILHCLNDSPPRRVVEDQWEDHHQVEAQRGVLGGSIEAGLKGR